MRPARAGPARHGTFQVHRHLREAPDAPEGETYLLSLATKLRACSRVSVLTVYEKILSRLSFHFYAKTTVSS